MIPVIIKHFHYEYIGNMPTSTSTSFAWNAAAATWWNANKPAGEPAIPLPLSNPAPKRILQGKRAIIYLENQRDEALDSTMVMSMPFQFMVRWIRSATYRAVLLQAMA